MLDTFLHWFSSLNNTEIIALVVPIFVVLLGGIGWLIKRKFDKRDIGDKTHIETRINSHDVRITGDNNITRIKSPDIKQLGVKNDLKIDIK